MAKTDITTIKNWFKTGLKPSQIQFWNTWDSFWHKDEKIPISSIEDLGNAIDNKSDVNHTHSNYATNNAESLTATNVEQWKEKLGVADLKFDDESITITQYYPEFDLSPGAPISVFNNLIYSEVNKKLNAPIENNSNEYVLLADGTTAPKTDFGKVDTVMGVQANPATKNVDISAVAMNWTNASQKMTALPDKSADSTYNQIVGMDANGNLAKIGGTCIGNKLLELPDNDLTLQQLLYKLNGSYAVPSAIKVNAIVPSIIAKDNTTAEILLLGENLNVMEDSNLTKVELLDLQTLELEQIPFYKVSKTELKIYINTLNYGAGDYKVKITSGVQSHISTRAFTISEYVKIEKVDTTALTFTSSFYPVVVNGENKNFSYSDNIVKVTPISQYITYRAYQHQYYVSNPIFTTAENFLMEIDFTTDRGATTGNALCYYIGLYKGVNPPTLSYSENTTGTPIFPSNTYFRAYTRLSSTDYRVYNQNAVAVESTVQSNTITSKLVFIKRNDILDVIINGNILSYSMLGTTEEFLYLAFNIGWQTNSLIADYRITRIEKYS